MYALIPKSMQAFCIGFCRQLIRLVRKEGLLSMGWKCAVVGVLGALLSVSSVSADDVSPADVKFEDGAVASSISGQPGDPVKGAATFLDRSLGNCLACHANKAMEKELFHGDVGPTMDGVAERYTPEQLRAIVANAKKVFGPDTIMPGFYTLEVGKYVRDDLVGKTVLSPQQVEDVVAYLVTLK